MNSDFASLLTEEMLTELAGESAFDRGANYFADGHVSSLKEQDGVFAARVQGTRNYRVNLWTEDEHLAFECDCPVGQDLVFCKHCVAVGLACLDRRKQKIGAQRRQTKREAADNRIRAHLMARDKGHLIELLMQYADSDPDFRGRLILAAARGNGKAPDFGAFRSAIDKAIRPRSFVKYERMPEYARGIDTVIDSLEDLLKAGHANEVRELTERALGQMESAMNHMDDSDGFMEEILDRLQSIHLSACRSAKPDPRALAKFLFKWEITSGWEIFLDSAQTYADVLGKAGLSEYRKLAESDWAKVPPLAPGEDNTERYGARWRITRIMETLASQTGDVEALVAVKSRDLSLAFSFFEIAQIYKAAGKVEAALEWAERGARAFPANTDNRLRDFLIHEYHERGRHDEAIAIAWASFQESPNLTEYRNLHRSALYARNWPNWREKALLLLQEEISASKKQPMRENEWHSSLCAEQSTLVEIYLWERDVEAAWNAAKGGGCYRELRLRLAEAREKKHPEDALSVYKELLTPTLHVAQQSAYEEAVNILGKIQRVTARTGRVQDFGNLVQSIRSQYKARRNFMKLLGDQGWS